MCYRTFCPEAYRGSRAVVQWAFPPAPICRFPAELHQRLLSEDHVSDRPLGSAAERRGENSLQAVGANVPAGQALPFMTLSFVPPHIMTIRRLL